MNFTKRNYECTNILFCQSTVAPKGNWIECDASEINCELLGSQEENGVIITYFGYM